MPGNITNNLKHSKTGTNNDLEINKFEKNLIGFLSDYYTNKICKQNNIIDRFNSVLQCLNYMGVEIDKYIVVLRRIYK